MSRLQGFRVVALLVLGASPAFAVQPADHTVAWYRTHQQARESVLQACQNDHSYDNAADCKNALSAAHGAVADTFAKQAARSKEPEADPAYYTNNGPLIAMTLSMCSRSAAPQTWCRAATTAKASIK